MKSASTSRNRHASKSKRRCAWAFVAVALVPCAALCAGYMMLYTAYGELELKAEKLAIELDLHRRESSVLSSLLENSRMDMQRMAYHQATKDVSSEFTFEQRENFSPKQWEDLLLARTNALLEEYMNPNRPTRKPLPPASSSTSAKQ